MIEIDVIQDHASVDALQSDWEQLLQRSSQSTIFQTFEWAKTWLDHFGDDVRLLTLVARDEGQVVGIAPLAVDRVDGFRNLGVIGGRTLDYDDFVISDDCRQEDVVAAFWRVLRDSKGWDCLRIHKLREDSPALKAFVLLSDRREMPAVLVPSDVCPYLDIDRAWDEYWNSRRARFRKDSRRCARTLGQEHGPVLYEEVGATGQVEDRMLELFTHYLTRQQGVKGRRVLLARPGSRDFYIALAKRLSEKRLLRLSTLSANGSVVGIQLGFEYKNIYAAYMSAFCHDLSRYSIGRLLDLHLLEDAFRRGLREFDFLRGDEAYKGEFTSTKRRLYSLSIFRPTIRGILARQWFLNVRPFLRLARDAARDLIGSRRATPTS